MWPSQSHRRRRRTACIPGWYQGPLERETPHTGSVYGNYGNDYGNDGNSGNGGNSENGGYSGNSGNVANYGNSNSGIVANYEISGNGGYSGNSGNVANYGNSNSGIVANYGISGNVANYGNYGNFQPTQKKPCCVFHILYPGVPIPRFVYLSRMTPEQVRFSPYSRVGRSMKDKVKSDKPPPLQDGKTEEERQKENLSDTDANRKNGETKNQDRAFLDPKTENLPRPEDGKDEDGGIGAKVKPENINDATILFTADAANIMLAGGPDCEPAATSGGMGTPQPGIAGVQPLPSNVINKQPGTMEAQYMQQQSQIFVFSTSMANKAAETVIQGQYPSIIAYHIGQPGTKKYLEKHPLKLNQFNRQSPAQWLNNLAQFKQKGFGGAPGSGPPPPHGPMMPPKGPRGMGDMGPRMMGPGGPPNPSGPMHDLEGLPDGPDMGNKHMDFHPMNSWNPYQQGMNQGGGMGGPCQPPNPGSAMRDKSCMGGRPPPMDSFQGLSPFTLTGTKVPNENLTPQQRQHREEQLATIRKMQQLFFPENHAQQGDDFTNARMGMPMQGNPHDGPPNGNMNGPHGRRPMDGPMNSPMMGPNPNVGSPMAPPNNMGMGGPMGPNDGSEHMGPDPNFMQKMPAGHPVPAQMEWQNLQQQFYEDRKKKGGRTDSPAPRGNKMMPGMGMGPSGPMQPGMQPQMHNMPPQGLSGMPGQMVGAGNMHVSIAVQQGPPPPYHASVRSTTVPNPGASPAPESPSNSTCNLSLSSPRTTSDINSPSDMNKIKMNTCSPPTNLGSPACNKPDTPASATQSPSSNKEVFARGPKVAKTGNGTPGLKEPNLMPVPSPQQIQYLNTFDAQELTIQKQPNTSLKDPSTASPLNSQQMADTPPSKTPTMSNNSPSQQHGSPRFNPHQQQQQQQQQHGLVGPQTPLPPTPAKGENNGVLSSPEHGGCGGPSPLRQPMSVPPATAPADNIPLNPNGGPLPPTSKSLQFDPITSLAQMSQQLTSQAPACQGSQFPPNNMMPMDQGMHIDSMDSLPFVPQQGPQMMDMPGGYMNNPSPKPGMGSAPGVRCGGPGQGPPYFGPQFPPRMMGPQSFNGMNVQVKASTPNTIQYLPARPTSNNSMPPMPGGRNPPSLEFLQRFTNPQMGGPGGCHPDPNMMMGGQMLRGQLRPGMKPGPPNMGKPSPGFDPMGMGPQVMFKGGGPMSMGNDASQPLPPTMGQTNSYKNSPFVGPTISDPNYAQQFHNFQQQLYATNTRSQINAHVNQSYFMPK